MNALVTESVGMEASTEPALLSCVKVINDVHCAIISLSKSKTVWMRRLVCAFVVRKPRGQIIEIHTCLKNELNHNWGSPRGNLSSISLY